MLVICHGFRKIVLPEIWNYSKTGEIYSEFRQSVKINKNEPGNAKILRNKVE